MDEQLKQTLAFHQAILDGFDHRPRDTPRESVMIVLLGEILKAVTPKSAPAKGKKKPKKSAKAG